jgi:hypothetical protein
MDGRLPDLEGSAPATLIPLVSHNWLLSFPWTGAGEMPEALKSKLRETVAKAHGQGRKLRFWATPDAPALWDELLGVGVDFIGSDDLDALEGYLRERDRDRERDREKEREKEGEVERESEREREGQRR